MPEPKTIEYVDVGNLRFDPLNPRFPKGLNGKVEAEVFSWMLRDATIIELMGSIGELGYFPGEPLLVAKTNKKGVFEVVEGNRRLTAVKLLREPELAPVRKKAVRL